jgi:hypothetical protein
MANPASESNEGVLRLDFDGRLMLQFRGSVVTSDAGLLAYRELDDALGLTAMAGEMLADARAGKNGRHALAGLFRQSVFGRLAGYEDVNDAERLRHDPAMRDRRRQGRLWLRCIANPNGPLRDPMSDGGEEPRGARRFVWAVDRPRPRPASTARHFARHGLKRQSDAW